MKQQIQNYPFAFIRGQIVPIEHANIPITTNSLHYGTGVFEGIRTYQVDQRVGIFRLDEHIKRIKQSCKILRFTFSVNESEIKRIIVELSKKNNITSGSYIRPLLAIILYP